MEVESELVRLYIFVHNAVEVAPHVNYALDPGAAPARACIQPARAPCDLSFVLYKMDEYESVSDRRRRLTRQRVQRHRRRTDEARRETARAANGKRLGRQN